MTLHVAINGFFWDKATVGVGQYLHGFVNAIQRIDAIRLTLIIPADTTPPPVPQGVRLHRVTSPFAGRSRNLAKLWFEQIAVPQAAKLIGADLLHVPYFAPPYYSDVPVITTIPDLIPLTRPAYRGSPLVRLYTALVTRAARRSHGLIAISQHVADQAAQLLAYPSDQISVTHLAADPIYTPQLDAVAVVAQQGIVGPYIYYVGGYDERKNVVTLLRAFATLPATIRNHGWSSPARPLAATPHSSRISTKKSPCWGLVPASNASASVAKPGRRFIVRPPCLSTRRLPKALGCPRSKQWPVARLSSSVIALVCPKSSAMRPVALTPPMWWRGAMPSPSCSATPPNANTCGQPACTAPVALAMPLPLPRRPLSMPASRPKYCNEYSHPLQSLAQ